MIRTWQTFAIKSANFHAREPILAWPVSAVLGRIGGEMAELLMKSAIATLTWRRFAHDQLRRQNHLDRG